MILGQVINGSFKDLGQVKSDYVYKFRLGHECCVTYTRLGYEYQVTEIRLKRYVSLWILGQVIKRSLKYLSQVKSGYGYKFRLGFESQFEITRLSYKRRVTEIMLRNQVRIWILGQIMNESFRGIKLGYGHILGYVMDIRLTQNGFGLLQIYEQVMLET